MKKLKKFAAVFLITGLLLQMAAGAINLTLMSHIRTSGDVKMIFRGMEMRPSADGQSVQGFLEIRLKGIATTGAGFSLMYDTNYLSLSNVSDNNPTSKVLPEEQGEGFFDQNEDDFPIGCFINTDNILLGWPQDIAGSQRYGTVHMNFVPDVFAAIRNPDIMGSHYKDGLFDTTDSGSDGYLLGRISFRINDPAGLAQLSVDNLKNVIRVNRVPVKDAGGGTVLKDDVTIGYLNDEGEEEFYDTIDYLDYEFELTATIKNVRPDNESSEVLASDIFIDGTQEDLINYLNRNMRELTLTYTDDSELPASMLWGDLDRDFSVTPDYDPKGGSYTVTQMYNDTLGVSVTVNVKPVSVIGYKTDFENVAYASKGLWPIKGGDVAEMTDLPMAATPIFSESVKGKAVRDIAEITQWNAPPDLSDLNSPADNTIYIFSGTVNTVALEEKLPWLTPPTADTVSVTRMVGEKTGAPEGVSGYATTLEGKLVIRVEKLEGLSASAAIPDGTSFMVKLPNGYEIPEKAVSVLLDVNVNPPEGETKGKGATITVDPNEIGALQELVQKYINLGGNFSIAAQEIGKAISEYTEFASTQRTNVYLAPESGGTEYVFDYSGSRRSLLPIGISPVLSTVFTLPDGDFIRTSISADGTNNGKLQTFSVDSWNLLNSASARPDQPAQVLTYEGVLKNENYPGMGQVTNPDGIKVRLIVKTVDNKLDESVVPIDDFYFEKQRVGYEVSEAKQFTVNNNGSCAISGLSVRLTDFSFVEEGDIAGHSTEVKGFEVTMNPLRYLLPGADETFEISTLPNLKAGTYSAKVELLSDQKQPLTTFNVYFTVTVKELYTVIVEAKDDDHTASTVDILTGSKYYEGESVRVYAKPGVDGKLERWFTDDENITNDNFTRDTAYAPPAGTDYSCWIFTMPAHDITVTGEFTTAETSRLRLEDLRIMDLSQTESEVGYKMYDSLFRESVFDASRLEWNVIVPNDITETKLQFKPRDPTIDSEGAEFQQSITVSTYVGTFASGSIQADGYYKPNDIIELDGETYEKCDVTVHREFKSGEQTITLDYTVHIYRAVGQNDLFGFGYGNTPFGEIMRDESYNNDPSIVTDEDKSAAVAARQAQEKADFENTYRYNGIYYSPKAWNEENIDKDEYAIVVYEGEKYTDLFTGAVNSIGQEIPSEEVTKTISVEILDDTSVSLSARFENADLVKRVFMGDKSEIDLFGTDWIRPGAYIMKYSFTDFDGQEQSRTRKIVVLSKLGDVNADGLVNSADSEKIESRITELLPYTLLTTYGGDATIYRYRVCDVTQDEAINANDASAISGGVIKEFYRNISGI